MNRTLLVIAALTALALCFSVAACGDGDDSSAGDTPKADAGKKSGLGEARFDALDAAGAAGVPLDRFVDDANGADATKFRAAAQPFLKACDALDPSDPLLAALRRGCPLLATYIEQAIGFDKACQDPSSCVAAVKRVRRTLVNLQRFERMGDRVIDATDMASACKDALRTPKRSYVLYDKLESAFGVFQGALASGSQADLDEAQRRMEGLDTSDLTSTKQRLEKFRASCA